MIVGINGVMETIDVFMLMPVCFYVSATDLRIEETFPPAVVTHEVEGFH